MKQQGLLTNTILLMISSLLVRTCSMICIILLSRILGEEGVGFYQLLMSIYMTGVIFASAGLSTSVSKIVAEEISLAHEYNVSKTMRLAISTGLLTSIFVSFVVFLTAPFLVDTFIHIEYMIKPLRILAFSIPFIACSSCFKGYFYAMKKTIFPASSEVLEQLVKLCLILILVKHSGHTEPSYTYQAITLGLTLGEMISWSYLFSLFMVDFKKHNVSKHSSLSILELSRRLFDILIPIAIISYVSYIFLTIENIVIPNGLNASGQSLASSMGLYGIVKGMILPIIFFPSAFLTAFSTNLIPEISRYYVLKQHRRIYRLTECVIQFTFILSIFFVSIFLTYGDELGLILYHNESVGPLLRMLAIIVPFVYLEVICDGILKGLNAQMSCLKYSIADSICRILLLYILLPFKGIYAFIGITILSCIFTCSLNFNKLVSLVPLKLQPMNWLFKPIIAATFCSCYSRLILNKLYLHKLNVGMNFLLGASLMILLYLPLLYLLQTISPEDMSWLRKQIHKLLKKPEVFPPC